ncbi:MAG TPA: tRNA (adenosine(37)-N6)-threonylcarbamoyltransferase complex dimerization subunit type 1 TsaB [Candidatus Acidoferrales bacterium]|nr:tRNA (adenosine(37)-N6)-threonylcarbamoyltransferase complex dimerization subunit type 1 TsaB [Candidatus Acidoferrales bacterium]
MLILAIDTTSRSGSVALLRDLDLMSAIASSDDEPFSSWLFRDVDRLMLEAAASVAGVDLFAVATGPGSFTGVRVGLAAVKAWAEVYRKPVAAVSALEAMASQASPAEPLVAGMADAHRGQLFAGLYDRAEGCEAPGLRRRGDDVVLPPAECLAYLAQQAAGSAFLIRTTALEMVRAALAASPVAGARAEQADAALAPAIGRMGYARARRGELVNALTLDAHYVRRSDAELLWKDR